MADTFLLEIVTPARKLLSQEVEELNAPGAEGEFGVLAGHTNFLTTLKAGEIIFKKGSEVGYIAASRGYAEVLADKTTILVDEAYMAADISAEGARAEAARAEEALKGLTQESPEFAKANDAYEFAQAKLKVLERRG